MITYVVGDLFESPAQVLVNTVNTVGVMGKGIAKDFKRIYPEMFTQYQSFCERGLFNVGQLWLYKTSHKWILNFPTKQHWRSKSKIEYIEAGLEKFAATHAIKGITSISFPRLGCGNGELDWKTEVQPLMEKYLKKLPIDIYIHLVDERTINKPEHRNIKEIEAWLRGEPESLAFVEFWKDLTQVLKKKHEFNLIGTDATFRASYNENSEEITINYQDIVTIDKESFVYLWQYIRDAGFTLAQNMPEGFDFYAPQIISVLTELPYIKPMRMSTNSDNLTEIGIQIKPTSLLNSVYNVAKPA